MLANSFRFASVVRPSVFYFAIVVTEFFAICHSTNRANCFVFASCHSTRVICFVQNLRATAMRTFVIVILSVCRIVPFTVCRMIIMSRRSDYKITLRAFYRVGFVSLFSIGCMRFKVEFIVASRASIPVPRTVFPAVLRCIMRCSTAIRCSAKVTNRFCCASCRSARASAVFFMTVISLTSAGMRSVTVAYPIVPVVIVVCRNCKVSDFISALVIILIAPITIFMTFCSRYHASCRNFLYPRPKIVSVRIYRNSKVGDFISALVIMLIAPITIFMTFVPVATQVAGISSFHAPNS